MGLTSFTICAALKSKKYLEKSHQMNISNFLRNALFLAAAAPSSTKIKTANNNSVSSLMRVKIWGHMSVICVLKYAPFGS